jgi:hypothetical protein
VWRKSDKRRAEVFYRREDAGPDMDREVESRVASVLHRNPVPWKNPPNYSVDVARAHFLLDVAERRLGAKTAVAETPSGWACSFDFGGEDEDLLVGRGDTEALAICAAFMTKIRKPGPRRFRGGFLKAGSRRLRRAARRLGRARVVRAVRKTIGRLLFP